MSHKAQSAADRSRKRVNVSLWTIQTLLALVFLFAGGMKLVVPVEMLKGPVPLPGTFMRFIGVCETLGALGLILPGVFEIRTGLTPLAASGLVIIMIGATTVTLIGGLIAPAVIPVVVGCLAASIVIGRWRFVPLASRRPRMAQVQEPAHALAEGVSRKAA